MLNEERVKHMTRMAMFEQNAGRKVQPALHFHKSDYLKLCTIGHVFLGTAVYGALILTVVGALYSTVWTNIHLIGTVLGFLAALMLYIVFIYGYLKRIKNRYAKKYDEAAQLTKQLQEQYLVLEQLYAQEEEILEPEGWE